MTLEELNLHFNAVSELNSARDRLQSMTSFLKAQNLDGMPKSGGESRKVEKLAILIEDQAGEVDRMERIIQRSEPVIREWIDTIPDNRTAQIFSLRFLAGYEWQEVAQIVGGKNTEGSVKATCYRYLRISDANEPVATAQGAL